MSFNEFLSRLERLGEIVEASELLRGKSPNDESISSKEACKAAKDKYDDANRLLKIGILGRVKAGKSTFLNALLFGGEDILPTAATPKTAALSILEYSPKPSVSVEFYNEADLNEIKKKASEYEKLLKERTEEILARFRAECASRGDDFDEKKQRESAQNEAFNELASLEKMLACYQQQKELDKSKISKAELKKHKEIHANLGELRVKLENFVGERGKFTPYTKSITLRLNNEFLKDVQIIDTPGLDDPVPSRTKRTNDYLSECDAVLLLSNVTKFLSSDDADLVANLAGTKNAARIFFVVSKFDRGLRNPQHASKGFDEAFEDVLRDKVEHLNKTLQEGFGELDKDAVARVLKEKLVHSSSVCASIVLKNAKNLSKTESGALEELKKRFESDFKDERQMSSLKKLANIDSINGIFDELKESKKELFESQAAEFLSKRVAAFEAYKKDLQEIVEARIKALKNNDLKSLQEKAEVLSQKESGEGLLDDNWNRLCKEFCLDLSESLKRKHSGFFDEFSAKIESSKTEDIEKTGIFRKDYHHLKGINASDARSAITNLCDKLENLLNNESQRQLMSFRTKVENEMGKGSALSAEIGTELLDEAIFKKCLREIFDKNVSLRKFSYELPDFISSVSGIIKDTHDGWIFHDYTREGTRLCEQCQEFYSDFRKETKKDIENLMQSLEKGLKFDFGAQMFKGLADEIEAIQKDLQEGVKRLDEYGLLKKEIESV